MSADTKMNEIVKEFNEYAPSKDTTSAIKYGYAARDRHLHEIMFGASPDSTDLVELALKAYSQGHADGSADADAIISKFQAFVFKVRNAETSADTHLAKEADELLNALRKSRE